MPVLRIILMSSDLPAENLQSFVSGHHYRSARTGELGQITVSRHLDRQRGALSPDDRAINVRLQECALQAPPSSTSTTAGIPELARLAGSRKCPRLLERDRVQSIAYRRDQI